MSVPFAFAACTNASIVFAAVPFTAPLTYANCSFRFPIAAPSVINLSVASSFQVGHSDRFPVKCESSCNLCFGHLTCSSGIDVLAGVGMIADAVVNKGTIGFAGGGGGGGGCP